MRKKELKCLNCGKYFSVANWRIGKAKYCSCDCYNARRTTPKSYHKKRVCKGCGKYFLPTQWYQKFCNRSCFCKSIKKTGIKICKNCGKEFLQVRITQKYCSRNCSSPYKDKRLKKPKLEGLDNLWSKCVKIKAGGKCEYCGKTTGLNSHHIFSRSNKRVRWNLDNGVCVCVLHHIFGLFSAHKAPIEFIEWLKEKRGNRWYNKLRKEAKIISPFKKPTKEEESLIREALNYKCKRNCHKI